MSGKSKGKQSTPLPSLLNSIRNVVNSNSNTTSQHNHQEVRPLISPSNDSHSHYNNVNNTNSNIIKGYLDRFNITSVSEIGKPRRTIKSIGFRTRDKRDVSGKKEFRVHVPARILVYTIVIFLILPLILGFGLLIRLVFRHHFEESGQSGHHLRKDDFTNIIVSDSEALTFNDDKALSILDMNNTFQKEDEDKDFLSKSILQDQEFNNTTLSAVTNNENEENQSTADDYHSGNILSDNENIIYSDGNSTSNQQEQQNQEDSNDFQQESEVDNGVKDSQVEYYENASLQNRTEIISGP